MVEIAVSQRPTPLVLAVGGHDPSGAGIQADIETAAAFGCHAASLVTCLTTQNTGHVAEVIPTTGAMLLAQFELLTRDLGPIAACKIGLVPTLDSLQAIVTLVARLPATTPVVLDPVLAAGSGGLLTQAAVRRALLDALWPLVSIRTPNGAEAAALARADNEPDPAAWLRTQRGWLLLKGADDASADVVVHRLLRDGRPYAVFRWPRLHGRYHGTGCTLATALASCLAHGATVAVATAAALDYTWRSLLDPLDFGGAQRLPRRLRRCVA